MIPWIGRPDYIRGTVKCLLNQDYPNMEILISDNSLSTPVEAYLDDRGDPRIRVVTRDAKRLSSANHFTECIRDASGEYVMILSDDDLIEQRYVSGMWDAIKAHPSSNVVLGEQIAIGKDDFLQPPESGSHLIRNFDGVRFLIDRLLHPKTLPIITYVSLFARRSEMLKFPYRDYPDGSNSDNFMMMCLALHGEVTVSSRKMYYRVYENSAGLRTPFSQLLESCRRYERDVTQITGQGLDFRSRVLFRILLRIRNCSMMARRLFSLYRRRMTIPQWSVAFVRLALYCVGVGKTGGS